MSAGRVQFWRGQGIRYNFIEHEDGGASIVRTTDYDSGQPQTVRLPEGALGPLIAAVVSYQFSRMARGLHAHLAAIKSRSPGG